MTRSPLSLAIVLLGFSLGCQPEAITGNQWLSMQPTKPPPNATFTSLTVKVLGRSMILREGTYFYTARSTGGAGEYQYRWEVSKEPVVTSEKILAASESTTPVATVLPDGTFMIRVLRGDADLSVKVTVSAGGEQAVSSILVRNCIGTIPNHGDPPPARGGRWTRRSGSHHYWSAFPPDPACRWSARDGSIEAAQLTDGPR